MTPEGNENKATEAVPGGLVLVLGPFNKEKCTSTQQEKNLGKSCGNEFVNATSDRKTIPPSVSFTVERVQLQRRSRFTLNTAKIATDVEGTFSVPSMICVMLALRSLREKDKMFSGAAQSSLRKV